MADIEKTIHKNIANMMLTPATFIDTQLLKKDIVKIIHKLQKHAQFSVHIIGNWDKESEPFLIKLLQSQSVADAKHCVFSNKLQQLKPHDGYYSALVDHCDVDPKDCLVIDVEKKHIQNAKNLGMTTILIQGQSSSQLKNELSRHHIQV
jgi:FMN phosphatase YigB (HAD superfamily)